MKLAVDIMGFENDPTDAVKSCIDFAKKNKDVEIILVGDRNRIKVTLPESFKFVDAQDEIKMTDNPLQVRNRFDSSMYKAIKLVKDGDADGVLSAGSTPCYVALTFLLLGKIENVNKHAFMPFVPTRKGTGFIFLDVGAQKECSGEDLLEFAIMADIFVKNSRKIKNPKIGLLNIGTEKNKGFSYHIEADELLSKEKDLNYVGFIESRTLLEGETDIVVADGYTGNMVLKAIEGAGKTVFSALKDEFKKPTGWLGLLFSTVALLRLKKKFDYKNNAGALVIGLNKTAVKTHGSADYKQFYSSLRLLREVLSNNVIEDIKKRFKDE